MSDSTEQPKGDAKGIAVDESLILELNFVPQWARKPASEVTFDGPARRERPRMDRRDSRDRNRRPDRRPDKRSDRRPDRAPRPPRAGEADPRNDYRPQREERPRQFEREQVEMPPVRIRFLPDQSKLSAVTRKIHATRRAFPIADLANLVLGAPDACYVKIESGRGKDAIPIYQCKVCRTVSLDHQHAMSHATEAHLSDYFDKEDTEREAPNGVFVCVARCGITGALLGPPNHHNYEKRIKEVHQARCPGMPLAQYRDRIQTVREPEAIEKWKEESRRTTVYKLKQPPPDSEAVEMDLAAACHHFVTEIAESLVVKTRTASVPLPVARQIDDPKLRLACQVTWRRENRFPQSMVMALRAAFSHMHLHVFRAGENMHFVTAVEPAPLNPEHTVENIRQVLDFLGAHAGAKRAELVEGLQPGADKEAAAAILAPLGWLTERGHLIEFFDGSLSVPLPPRKGKRAEA